MSDGGISTIGDIVPDFQERIERLAKVAAQREARGDNPAAPLEANRERARLNRIEAMVRDVVPARYLLAEADEALVERFDAAVGDGRGIILTGPPGVGKTHAMCALIRRFLEREERPAAVYHGVGMLLTQLRPGGHESPLTLLRLSGVKLLALDDLGAHNDSDWVQETLFTLLNARYQDMRSTLIATNVPVGDFAGVFGQRMTGRLAETCDVIPMTGADRRMMRVVGA